MKPNLAALYCSSQKFRSEAHNSEMHGLRARAKSSSQHRAGAVLQISVSLQVKAVKHRGDQSWCLTATLQPQSYFCLLSESLYREQVVGFSMLAGQNLNFPYMCPFSMLILSCCKWGKTGWEWSFRIRTEFPFLLSVKTLVCMYQSRSF